MVLETIGASANGERLMALATRAAGSSHGEQFRLTGIGHSHTGAADEPSARPITAPRP